MVAQVSIQEGIAITQMTWSCEKFKMDDSDEEQRNTSSESQEDKTYSLAVSFIDGTIYIMRNYDDIFPIIIRTGLLQLKIEWSNNGEILAIAGHQIRDSGQNNRGDRIFTYRNIVQFYTFSGVLRLKTELECTQYPITAITWGHSDKRLFTAVGPILYIAWITKRIPSLQLLSRLSIYNRLSSERLVEQLPLPQRLQTCVANLFSPTLQCYLLDLTHLRDFISSPPNNNVRLHCTMIRHEDDLISSSTTYILYLEYLGGLVPILKGKRASKLKPEFIIFDPQLTNCETNNQNINQNQKNFYYASNQSTPYTTTSSDSEAEDNPAFGRSPSQTRRRRRFRRHFRSRNSNESSNTSLSSNSSSNSSKYADEMPEQEKLVLVTSNIWGTKFKILGLSSWLPSQLGSINYRTSLLHLQPRQMTLAIKELGEKRLDSGFAAINKFENNNNFISSDSEDEVAMSYMLDSDISAPIAPMTPKKNIRSTNTTGLLGQTRIVSPEKRPTYQQFQCTGIQSTSLVNTAINGVDYNNCAEELLILQINGDSHYLSMEMSGTIHNNPLQAQCHSSISTQTSFQSITELLNSLTTLEKNTQTLLTTTALPIELHQKSVEEQTEETFTRIAKRFAAELPQSYYSINSSSGKSCVESLHSPALISLNSDLYYPHFVGSTTCAPTTESPAVSPPKAIRYKIGGKKESPRKSSVSCIESDLTANSRGCDTSAATSASNRFVSSPKSQRRYPYPIVSSTPSASTWAAVAQVLHCNSTLTDNLSIDSKHSIMTQNIANDFKYIDDFEATEEGVDLRSPTCFQKNRSICHMQPTIGTEFTNVRNGSEGSIGHTFHGTSHTFQRRLTLKASKQSHSFDISSDTPTNHSLIEPKKSNSRSLEEEAEEDSDEDYSMTDSFISAISDVKTHKNQIKHLINNKNNNKTIADCNQRHINNDKTQSPATVIAHNSCTTPTCADTTDASVIVHNNCIKKSSFNCMDNKELTSDNPTDHRIHSRYNCFKSSESIRSVHRDQDSGAVVGADIITTVADNCAALATHNSLQRLHNHRASLPQAIASTSNSTNSIDTSSATTAAAVLNNRSLPASPLLANQRRRRSQGKSLLYSPSMLRKVMKQKLNYLDCSSDSEQTSDDEDQLDRQSSDFKNLETFQKRHFRKKFKVTRRNSRVKPEEQTNSSPQKQTVSYREFILHNKAPLWNEVSQVYQLDFGGRVTQESAKNFQIEYQGKQVMQFGRIDGNAYTLDFQYPFSALQALAVALANVTQRLK